jgi:peroxiredoxin/uncharacterized membrane protein YphA (DoxX/SURF4 family)
VTLALVVVRLALASVFGAAGVGKLLDQQGSRGALANFGVPRPLAAPAALLLPAVELIVAGVLLLPGATAWGAAGGFVLLVVFSAGVANSLLHGRRPVCHCFGRLRSSPASWGTLGRNAALAAAAAFVAVGTSHAGEPSAARYVQLLALVTLAGVLVVSVFARRLPWLSLTRLEGRAAGQPRLRLAVRAAARMASLVGVGRAPLRLLGLPIGTPAPDFRVRHPNGDPVTLTSLLSGGRPAMLVFSDAACRPCMDMIPQLARWQQENRSRMTIALVTTGSTEEKLAAGEGYGLENVLAQDDREVANAYEVNVTPSAVLVTPDAKIGSRLAVGELPIRALLGSLTDQARGQV